jgi:hypothetical protein
MSDNLSYIVTAPGGDELIDAAWLDEETVVMSRDQLNDLLAREIDLYMRHNRPTKRAIPIDRGRLVVKDEER